MIPETWERKTFFVFWNFNFYAFYGNFSFVSLIYFFQATFSNPFWALCTGYWISPYLLCQNRSAAARHCVCFLFNRFRSKKGEFFEVKHLDLRWHPPSTQLMSSLQHSAKYLWKMEIYSGIQLGHHAECDTKLVWGLYGRGEKQRLCLNCKRAYRPV